MADYYNAPTDLNSYFDTKGGNQNFVSGSSVLVLLRARLYGPIVNDAQDRSATSLASNRLEGDADRNTAGQQKTILVGAGIRSVSIDQQINITAEQGLGFFDIIEHVEHSVASNTFTMDKMMLRPTQLAKIGVAPFGTDVIRSPMLDAVIVDARLYTLDKSGKDGKSLQLVFSRLEGLHIQSNRMSFNTGTTVAENVTFRFDRMGAFDDSAEIRTIMRALRNRFPHIYQNFQTDMSDITKNQTTGLGF